MMTGEPNQQTTTTIEVDITSDLACPWCYVGKKRLELAIAELKKTHPNVNVLVRWHPFLLNSEIPPEGAERKQYFRTRFGLSDLSASPMIQHLNQIGTSLGIKFDFNRPSVVSSTINAHRLLMKLGDDGANYQAQNQLKHELFRSYFELGQDIGDLDVLKDAVRRVGVQDAISDEFIEQGNKLDDEYRLRVLTMNKVARHEQGITGVPFFTFNKKLTVSGGQETSVFLNILKKLL